MIAEAIDTAVTLGWALAVWIVLLAIAVTLAAYTVVAAVAWPCNAARDALKGALSASRAVRALRDRPDRYRLQQRPLWAAA